MDVYRVLQLFLAWFLRTPVLFGTLLAGLSAPATSHDNEINSSQTPNTAVAAIQTPAPSGSAQLQAAEAAVELNEHDAKLLALPTTRDHIGRVVVPVMVNDQGPFRFIVDTGANHSTISPGLVQRLGLKSAEASSILLDGITGTTQVSYVVVDRLQAGDLTMTATALPIVWAPVMAGADGILGAAGLEEKSLLVDFQRNRVVISRAVEAVVRRDAMKLHAVRLTRGLITLETRVGHVPVIAVLDTGSERTLGNIALRDALTKMPSSDRAVVQITSVYGATKEVEEGEIRACPPISLDTMRITDVAVVFGRFHIFKVWGMENRPAMIIGMDVLGTLATLGIDFKSQDVYFAGARVGNPFTPMNAGALGEQVQKH